MGLYKEFIRLEFMRMLAYRATYLTGIFNYTIQIGAYFFLWQAVYENQGRLGGMAQAEMLTYVIMAWIARSFYFNNLDRILSDEIREGLIATELIRPYSYQWAKMARSLGEALFRLLFFTIPGAVFIYLLHPFGGPAGWTAGALFGISLLGSFLINSQINLLVGYLAFFTLSISGILRAKRVVVDLLSGLIMPLSFYPPWAREVIEYLPFQAISYLPNMIYLGKITGKEALGALVLQGFWFGVLLMMSYFIWRLAVRKLTIQGG
ncbi:MAG: ABC transporter permease [Thermincolia bacterium]